MVLIFSDLWEGPVIQLESEVTFTLLGRVGGHSIWRLEGLSEHGNNFLQGRIFRNPQF